MTNTNLISGLCPTVTTGEPIAYSFALKDRSDENLPSLAGGRAASESVGDPGWVRFYRGRARELVYDLGEVRRIGGFSAAFLQNGAAGVYTPRRVELLISADGVTYRRAFAVDSKVSPAAKDVSVSVFEAAGGQAFSARYVRFDFECEVHVFASGFAVYPAAEDAVPAAGSALEPPKPDLGYLRAGDTAKNGVIIYCGYWDETMKYPESYVLNTPADLMPYVAYVDREGKIADTMYDSVYFLSLQSRTPSGGYMCAMHNVEKPNTYRSDWLQFLDNMFAEGYNIDALNTAAGSVKEALGLTDYKVGVHIQLPFPHPSGEDFGGGMRTDTLENRVAVCRWFMEEAVRRFDERNYEHLRLCSFYQGCESVPMAVSDEEEALFAAVNCEAHAMGLKASWIPCYLGTGFARWKELGFDAAYMQPNHMFNKYDAAMLGEFAQSCTRYGLGVELELNYTAVNPGENRDSEIERYYDYLRGGYYYGYIGCDTATYQGAGPGYIYTACYAEDPAVRAIYDNTYLFLKGTLMPGVPRVAATRVERQTDGSYRAALSLEGGSEIFGHDTTFEIVTQGTRGAAVVHDDELIYVPGYTFTGYDKLSVTAVIHGVATEVRTLTLNDVAHFAVQRGIRELNALCDKPKSRAWMTGLSVASAAASLLLLVSGRKNDKHR